MGRRWSRKRKAEQKDQTKKKGNTRKDYVPIFQGNPSMEAYYALQGLHSHSIKDGMLKECTTLEEYEEERALWMSSMREILPASFRIGTYVDESLRERLEHELDSHVGTEMEIVVEEQSRERHFQDPTKQPAQKDDTEKTTKTKTVKVAPARKISFVPHAYQLSVDRRTIRRNEALTVFHEWLKVQTTAGFITRQETVSMIPPVVLDVKPHHLVLDMCAAPGSKTSQLLEQVSMECCKGDFEPRGCVVANDSDPKRAYMLVHQLRRINSPAALVTACDAQFFPLLKSKEETQNGLEGMFDRVLCDVPCSGDGTARKNPGIWRHWNQLGALALHPLQISITLNGARLTKVGGYVCFSTCSMNPIENEAVVAEILRSTDGSLELVDKRPDMPGLVARPGWTSWKVLCEKGSRKEMKDNKKKNNAKMRARRAAWAEKQRQEQEAKGNGEEEPPNKVQKEEEGAEVDMKETIDEPEVEEKTSETANGEDCNIHDLGPPPAWDEATLLERAKAAGFDEYKSFEEIPKERRRRIRESCFPPTDEEVAKFGLEKCMRCLPHDMDTGGFFVALFKKVSPLGAKAKERAKVLALEIRGDVNEDGTYKNSGVADNKDVSNTGVDNAMQDATEEAESNIASKEDIVEENAEAAPANDNKVAKGKPLSRGPGKRRGGPGNENFIPISDDIWAPHAEFYGLSSSFPRSQFMARASGDAKVLYFIGNSIKTQLMDRGIQERVTVINSGLKAFERNSNKDCDVKYRVAQDGIHYIVPHMTKRKIICNFQDFSACLVPGAIRFEKFSSEFADAARPLAIGSFVVALEGHENNIFKKMYMVMWRCRGDAINCLVSKGEMDGMSSKLRALENESKE